MKKSELYKLLYFSFLAIRQAAQNKPVDDKFVYNVADLFHNVPYELQKADARGSSYIDAQVWEGIVARANYLGLADWLATMRQNQLCHFDSE